MAMPSSARNKATITPCLERAVRELIAVQFAKQAHKTPCRKQVHDCADRDKCGSKLNRELVGQTGGELLR